MGDDIAPYEKAIEETAKATSKAVDLIRDGGRAIGPAVADIYGVMIGDRVRAARVRNLDAINEKRRKKLESRGVSEPLQPPEEIAIPILEAAQGETREELQDIWASLLANAMDPTRAANVRPEFIETVRKMQPIDAELLLRTKFLHSGSWLQPDNIPEYRKSAVKVSLGRLVELKCISLSSTDRFRATDYGLELMFAIEE